MQAEWLSIDNETITFDSLDIAAAAMRQFAEAHGLGVSVSPDETYLHVLRLYATA